MAKKNSKIPANETKKQRFQRVCKSRVQKAIKAVGLIGLCCNKSNYDYTPADIDKLINRMNKEVVALRKRFEKPTEKTEVDFDF